MYDTIEVLGELPDERSYVHAKFHTVEQAEQYCRTHGYYATAPNGELAFLSVHNPCAH